MHIVERIHAEIHLFGLGPVFALLGGDIDVAAFHLFLVLRTVGVVHGGSFLVGTGFAFVDGGVDDLIVIVGGHRRPVARPFGVAALGKLRHVDVGECLTGPLVGALAVGTVAVGSEDDLRFAVGVTPARSPLIVAGVEFLHGIHLVAGGSLLPRFGAGTRLNHHIGAGILGSFLLELLIILQSSVIVALVDADITKMIKNQGIILLIIFLVQTLVLFLGMFHIAHDTIALGNLVGHTPRLDLVLLDFTRHLLIFLQSLLIFASSESVVRIFHHGSLRTANPCKQNT